jgi:hypothetical protein
LAGDTTTISNGIAADALDEVFFGMVAKAANRLLPSVHCVS